MRVLIAEDDLPLADAIVRGLRRPAAAFRWRAIGVLLGTVAGLTACASVGQSPHHATPAPPPAHLFVTTPRPAGASKPCDACLVERPCVPARQGSVDEDAITVDATRRYQTMDGFGYAMTDSSAYLIDQLPNDRGQRDDVMRKLFDPVEGIGINWIRIIMGASDFTVAPPPWYSYRPTQADSFDISRPRAGSPLGDESHIIPLLATANLLAPGQITFFADPHSAPAWMKLNQQLHNLTREQGCILGYCVGAEASTDVRDDYVQYFIDFLKAYQAHGVRIDEVGVQNEPGSKADFPSGDFAPGDQADFIDRLKRAFATQDPPLSPKVMAETINPADAGKILAQGATPRSIDGVAYYCYYLFPPQRAEILRAAAALRAAHPNTPIHETECTQDAQGFWQKTIDVLIDHSRAGASSVAGWNVALDPHGGPHSVICSKGQAGQCDATNRGSNMTAPVVISTKSGNVTATFTREYYEMGHFTKFVRRGAVRIASNALGPVRNVAFENPGGSRVLVVHNTGHASRSFAVNIGDDRHLAIDDLPGGAIATLTW